MRFWALGDVSRQDVPRGIKNQRCAVFITSIQRFDNTFQYLSGRMKMWKTSSSVQTYNVTHCIMTILPPPQFLVNQRLGCLGCPLASDNGLSDFKKYPNLVKSWCMNGQIWLDTHPNTASHKKFSDVYELFVHNVFYNTYEEFKLSIGDNLFGKGIDCKSFLEQYFNIKF